MIALAISMRPISDMITGSSPEQEHARAGVARAAQGSPGMGAAAVRTWKGRGSVASGNAGVSQPATRMETDVAPAGGVASNAIPP